MQIKKLFLVFSGVVAVVTLLLAVIDTDHLCSSGDTICMSVWHSVILNFLSVIPFFLFSLITYKMPEKVFRAWAWFALPWTALSMVLIYMSPEYGQSGFGPSISLDKGFVAFLMAGSFVLVSIVIIIVRYLSLRFSR